MQMIKEVKDWLIEYNILFKKNGNDYIILCPFHKDSNPSLSMNKDTGAFQCWSCKAKGNMATFIAKITNCDMKTAIDLVYGKSKIKFNKKSLPKNKIDNQKYNELIQIIYCFLFRDEAVLRLLDSWKDFADDSMFDELVETQKKIIKPDSKIYLKQQIFNFIIEEVDDVLTKDRYKSFMELVKKYNIKKEVKMALNLFNNNKFKEIMADIEIKKIKEQFDIELTELKNIIKQL